MKVATFAEKINNPVIGYVLFSAMFTNFNTYKYDLYVYEKKMGEFGGQNAHSTLDTDCESGV